jgi:RNA polymerase sigma factor (sigma-70 family)
MSEEQQRSDVELLLAAAEGDEAAFVEFCSLRLPAVKRMVGGLCKSYGLSSNAVEAVTHDALIQAVERLRSGPPSDNPHWLKEIARTTIRKRLRAAKRESKTEEFNERSKGMVAHPEDDTLEREELWDLARRVLKPRDYEVLSGIIRDELTQAEIAEKLGITTRTVRRAYRRALALLRDALGGHGGF